MIDPVILEQFGRLLDRASGQSREAYDPAFYGRMEESGFLDLLVTEEDGGANIALRDAFPLAISLGRRFSADPILETMVARRLLGAACPRDGFVSLGSARLAQGEIRISALPDTAACHVVVGLGERVVTLPLGTAESTVAKMRWTPAEAQQALPAGGDRVAPIALTILAARMAGAMQAVLATTLDHVKVRRQFGRALSAFQAVQQQIALLTEEAAAAHVAAAAAMDLGEAVSPVAAAAAKLRASEASVTVTGIAHALHGAIGVSWEHALPHMTQTLREWRAAFGAESAMADRVGRALMASGDSLSHFAQAVFQPAEPETDALPLR